MTFCIELSAGIWRLVDWKLAYHSDDIDQLYVNAKKYSEDNQYGWYARAWRSIHSKVSHFVFKPIFKVGHMVTHNAVYRCAPNATVLYVLLTRIESLKRPGRQFR